MSKNNQACAAVEKLKVIITPFTPKVSGESPLRKPLPSSKQIGSFGGGFLNRSFFRLRRYNRNTCIFTVFINCPPQARKNLSVLTSETSFFNGFLSNLTSNPEKFSASRGISYVKKLKWIKNRFRFLKWRKSGPHPHPPYIQGDKETLGTYLLPT